MSSVVIKIAGTDRTADVVFSTAKFMSAVNAIAGESFLRLRDLTSSLTPKPGDTLELLIDGGPVWTGWVAQAKRIYVFPAIGTDPARFYDLIGADLNLLFQRRIVFNQSTPENVLAPLYGPNTADTTAITDLLSDWLDLSGDGLDTTTGVIGVGTINEDQAARAWEGSDSWGQAMNSISLLPASIFYLRPNKELAYVDTDTPDAPFGLSDAPNGTTSKGYREMEILLDGTNLANDVLCWGAGYGSNVPVFVRAEDATSQSDHGLWQLGQVTFGIYKQATIDRVADSILNGSPEHHRGSKDNREAVTITTYEPGLLPAQKVNFESTVFNWSEVLPIRKMEVTFEAPDNPKYVLTLSQEIDTPWSFFDPWRFRFPGFRLPRFPPFPPLPIPEIPGGCSDAICGITDSFTRTVAEVVHNSNSGSTDADMGLSDSGVAYFNVVNGDQAWLLSNGGIGLSVNGASLVARIFADSGSGVVFGTASGYLRTSVSMDHSAIKSLTFTLSDLPNTGGNASTLVMFIPGGSPSGTKAARVFLNPGSIGATQSYIGFTATSSDSQVIPDAYWQAATIYTVTLQDDGAGTTITVSDGATTYSHTSAGYTGGTLENPALGVSSNTTGGAVTDEYTVTIDNLVIPEITRCSDFLYDSFARTEASSWGNASSGPPWDTYLDGSALGTISVVYGEGVMALGATTSGNAETPAVGPWNTADGFIGTFRFKTDTLGSDIFVDVSELAPGGNFEFTALLDNSIGFVEMASDGDDTVAKTDWATDTWYNVKYEYRPSGVARAKVWEYGTAEPGSWTVSTTAFPDAILNKLGYVGINGSGGSVEIDFAAIDFDYTGKPCYEQCPDIMDRFQRIVPSGWGTSDSGIEWIEQDGSGPGPSIGIAYEVTSSGGKSTVTDASTESGSIDLLLPVNLFSVYCTIIDYTTDDFLFYLDLTSPGDASGNYVYVDPSTSHFDVVDIPDSEDGSFDYDGNPFHIRIERNATETKAKIWYVSDPEPDWMVSAAAGTRLDASAISFEPDGAANDDTTFTVSFLEVTLLETVALFDDFERTSASSWGTATYGTTYVIIENDGAGTFSTNGSQGVISPDGDFPMSIKDNVPVTTTEGYVLRYQFVPGSGAADLAVSIQNSGATLTTTVVIHADITTNSLVVTRQGGGSSQANKTWAAGTHYWVELLYNHPDVEVRVWTTDRPSTADLTLDVTGDTPDGTLHHIIVGSGVQAGATGTFSFDQIIFIVDGCHDPVPPTPTAPEGPLFGPFCQAATRVDGTHYQLGRAFINLSEQVWVGTPGLLVRPGITLDYTTDPEAGMIVFNDPVTDGTRIYACFTSNGPPV